MDFYNLFVEYIDIENINFCMRILKIVKNRIVIYITTYANVKKKKETPRI